MHFVPGTFSTWHLLPVVPCSFTKCLNTDVLRLINFQLFAPHTQLWNCFFVTSVKKKRENGEGKESDYSLNEQTTAASPFLYHSTWERVWSLELTPTGERCRAGRSVTPQWPCLNACLEVWMDWNKVLNWWSSRLVIFSLVFLSDYMACSNLCLTDSFFPLSGIFSLCMNTFSIVSECFPQLCLSFRPGVWDLRLWIDVVWIQYFDS